MKDRFDNDINVGDTVVFINRTRYSLLDYGIVTELKGSDRLEILYYVGCYYEKQPSANACQDIIVAAGGLHTNYTTRESRNVSVMKNVSLQIETK